MITKFLPFDSLRPRNNIARHRNTWVVLRILIWTQWHFLAPGTTNDSPLNARAAKESNKVRKS